MIDKIINSDGNVTKKASDSKLPDSEHVKNELWTGNPEYPRMTRKSVGKNRVVLYTLGGSFYKDDESE